LFKLVSTHHLGLLTLHGIAKGVFKTKEIVDTFTELAVRVIDIGSEPTGIEPGYMVVI
jgi:hypothetical protein